MVALPERDLKEIMNYDELKKITSSIPDPTIFLNCDFLPGGAKEIPSAEDFHSKIQEYCKSLPHDRVVVTVEKVINQNVFITLHPVTSSA